MFYTVACIGLNFHIRKISNRKRERLQLSCDIISSYNKHIHGKIFLQLGTTLGSCLRALPLTEYGEESAFLKRLAGGECISYNA